MSAALLAPRSLLLAACLAAGAFAVSGPLEARAQGGATGETPAADAPAAAENAAPLAPADSAAIAAAMAASDSALAAAREPTRAERAADGSRFEFGAAMPKGYFDWLGTFGYRLRVRTDARFEHWIQAEAMGGKKDYLSEGAASFGYYIRPLVFWRPEWRIRPIVEGGIGGYLVVQFAEIEGFDDWSSHARGYVKAHAVTGFETDLSGRWGVALRGRFTIPASRPLDYAQLVLFLR